MKKTVTINGREYQLRYVYEKEDGSKWMVLNTDELQGKFGDEYPVK